MHIIRYIILYHLKVAISYNNFEDYHKCKNPKRYKDCNRCKDCNRLKKYNKYKKYCNLKYYLTKTLDIRSKANISNITSNIII